MLREIWYTLKDTLQSGDLPGHLRSFRRVLSGQVQPDDPAGSPTERHNPPAEACRAAQPGTGHPRACPPFSSSDRETGRSPSILTVTPLNIVPMRALLAYGRAHLDSLEFESTPCAACGEEVPPETVACPLCGQSARPL